MTKKTKHKKTPLTVRGIPFESGAACARHFGISKAAVYMAKRDGRLDYIGLGKGKKGEVFYAQDKPITILGVAYKSRRAAITAGGFSDSLFYRALRENRLNELFETGELTANTSGNAGDPITVNGIRYPSHNACAAALGVSNYIVKKWSNLGYPDEILKAKKLRVKRGNKTAIDGVTYPSLAAAARSTGVSPATLRKRKRAEMRNKTK